MSASLEERRKLPEKVHTTHEIADDPDRLNVVLVLGTGMDVPLFGQQFGIQLLYGHGLTGTADENWFSDWKTRELTLMLGYEL